MIWGILAKLGIGRRGHLACNGSGFGIPDTVLGFVRFKQELDSGLWVLCRHDAELLTDSGANMLGVPGWVRCKCAMVS